MSANGWKLGTCDCGRRYKRVKGHGGQCQWCRGWYTCHTCHQTRSLDYFTTHQSEENGWIIHAVCKLCASSRIKYETRPEILKAYGIEGKLLRIYEACIPAFIENQQKAVRKIKGNGRGGFPQKTKSDIIDRTVGQLGEFITWKQWLDIANALCETFRTEQWQQQPAGNFHPVPKTEPDHWTDTTKEAA